MDVTQTLNCARQKSKQAAYTGGDTQPHRAMTPEVTYSFTEQWARMLQNLMHTLHVLP